MAGFWLPGALLIWGNSENLGHYQTKFDKDNVNCMQNRRLLGQEIMARKRQFAFWGRLVMLVYIVVLNWSGVLEKEIIQ